jgi:hypothetical protein
MSEPQVASDLAELFATLDSTDIEPVLRTDGRRLQ